MYAIVEIAGQQFKVKEKQQIFVHRLEANEGDSITFDKVLLVDNEGSIQIGTPVVDGMLIKAKLVNTILSHSTLSAKTKTDNTPTHQVAPIKNDEIANEKQ